MHVLRSSLRPAVLFAREVSANAGTLFQTSAGPRAVFLPAYGRHGAALLRIYNVAAALRQLGWWTFVIPWKLTLPQRQRLIARVRPDVLVMQGARHALNRPEFYPHHPIVYDMDDADFHLPHLADPIERAMSQVASVVAGSRYIADWCRARGATTDIVWTATPMTHRGSPPQAGRGPVVAWAQSAPATYEDECAWVLDVMRRVSERRPDVRLRLYDRRDTDSEDFLDQFKVSGINVEWYPSASYGDYLRSFEDVALGLAPQSTGNPFSRGKSFGKVLAYLDRRVPVISSDEGEFTAFFEPITGVMSNDKEVWISEIARLIDDPANRQSMADMAHSRFRDRLSLDVAARNLDRILRRFAA